MIFLERIVLINDLTPMDGIDDLRSNLSINADAGMSKNR